MKKLTILSLAAVAILFTACGEDSKKAAAEATAKSPEMVQSTTSDVEKAAADLAVATKEKTEEVVDALKKKAVETTETVKKELSKEIVGQAPGSAGKNTYAKCSGCHGKDGKTKALGKSAVIAGLPATELATMLQEYKAGKRDVAGMGTLMKGQVTSLSEAEILAVAEYVSEL